MTDQSRQPTNQTTYPPDQLTNQPTNQPTNRLHQAEPFLRSYLLLTGMKVQWGRGDRGILLDESYHTSHIQCCIAAAPEMTLVLMASLLSWFRYYLDPEFAHNHDWEVPYWQAEEQLI